MIDVIGKKTNIKGIGLKEWETHENINKEKH